MASKHGLVEWVKRLIKSGLDIDEKNRLADTALFTASKGGYVEIVELLIQASAGCEQEELLWGFRGVYRC